MTATRRTHAGRLALALAIALAAFEGRTAAARVDQALVDAAKRQDWAAVQTLIKQGLDVNVVQPDGATALHWAAHWNDVATARALLTAGARANATNDLRVAPLTLACTNASASMVQVLLEGGADANTTTAAGETALMTCSRSGNIEAVRALISRGAKVDKSEPERLQGPLMWAAAHDHADVIDELVKAGADVNARTRAEQGVVIAAYRRALPESAGFTPILFAARAGAARAIDALLRMGASIDDRAADGTSVLQTAMSMGHWDLVPSLLDKGANPNDDGPGYTPLHWASGSWEALLSGVVGAESYRWLAARGPGKLALVTTLLDHGADPNRRAKKMPQVFGNFGSNFKLAGATPFILAGVSADVRIMRTLVEHGADPLLKSDNGTTALMTAAGLDQTLGISSIAADDALAAVTYAVSLGIDVNAANDDGETALHGAAYFGVNPVVEFLVEHGAAVNPRNRLGLTPTTVAQGYGGGGGILINAPTAALLRKLGGVGDVDMPLTPVATVRTACPALVVDFELSNPGYGRVYVTTSPQTRFVGGTCADVKEGTSIRVKGVRETDADKSWDGSVVASAIEIER